MRLFLLVKSHFACIMALCAAGMASSAFADGLTNANIAAEEYLKNRESIKSLFCRFQLSVGNSPSLDDAMQSRIKTSMVGQAIWAFDHKVHKFEMKCSKEDIIANSKYHNGGRIMTLSIAPEGMLTNGTYQLNYSPMMNNRGMIYQPKIRADIPGIQPFGMGVMGANEEYNPAFGIRKWIEEKKEIECFIENGERKELVVVLKDESGMPLMEYRFSVDHGYCLVGHTVFARETGKRKFVIYIPEVIKVPTGQWMPKRSILIGFPSEPSGKYSTRVIEVLEVASVDSKGKDVFSLELPDNHAINDNLNPNSTVRFEKAQKIFPDDLSVIAKKCSDAAKGLNRVVVEKSN